jgi:antitoxin MazE
MERAMQVSKWGNSLAIRLPKDVVEALGLKVGDELKVTASGDRKIALERQLTREEALERIRTTRVTLPEGYKFDREEANAR